jgi:prevent-host-death family protein
MEIYTASDAREQLYKLVDRVAQSHVPVCIIGKRNKVVVIAEEDFVAMQETLYLLSAPGMRESLIQSLKAPEDTYADTLTW